MILISFRWKQWHFYNGRKSCSPHALKWCSVYWWPSIVCMRTAWGQKYHPPCLLKHTTAMKQAVIVKRVNQCGLVPHLCKHRRLGALQGHSWLMPCMNWEGTVEFHQLPAGDYFAAVRMNRASGKLVGSHSSKEAAEKQPWKSWSCTIFTRPAVAKQSKPNSEYIV